MRGGGRSKAAGGDERAAALVGSLPEDENSVEVTTGAALANRYNTVRPLLAVLGETSALGTVTGGAGVLAGVKRLLTLARQQVTDRPLPPREVDGDLVPPAWRKAVYVNSAIPSG
ncbi:hypothetical protein [Streptomyces cyaneofuscatus]|uniref:hypothetical protein n=1 Tax=Streptomyces cyaneofuscatus TaxID=66883 RepID=UPI00381E3984